MARVGGAQLRASYGGWDGNPEHQQGDGDREDTVAKGFQAARVMAAAGFGDPSGFSGEVMGFMRHLKTLPGQERLPPNVYRQTLCHPLLRAVGDRASSWQETSPM